MEREIKGLSNGISFIYVGCKSKKLLTVKMDNLGYFLGPNGLSDFHYLLNCSGDFKFPVWLRFRLLRLF